MPVGLPRDEYEGALKVLARYYRDLMDEIVTDIIRNKEEFEKSGFGRAEELIDRHYTRRAHLGVFMRISVSGFRKSRRERSPSVKRSSGVLAVAA